MHLINLNNISRTISMMKMVEEFCDAVGGLVVTKYSNGHFSVCIDRLMGYKVDMSYMFTVHFQAKPLEVALILCFICRFVSQSIG